MSKIVLLLLSILMSSGTAFNSGIETVSPPTIEVEATPVPEGWKESEFANAKVHEGIELTITDAQPFESCPDTLHMLLTNKSDLAIYYGEVYYIEKMIDGLWYNIPRDDGYSFPLIAYVLSPDMSVEKEARLHGYTEKLDTGLYRIVYKIDDSVIFCEFQIV